MLGFVGGHLMRHGKGKYLPKVPKKLEAEQELNSWSPDPPTLQYTGQEGNPTSSHGRASTIPVLHSVPLRSQGDPFIYSRNAY